MAISDHFTIDVDARIIYHDDADPTIYTINELYSWLMDYFDDSTTVDDAIPMTAQTPTAYTLVNGWYIVEYAYSSFEYLKGGSIKSQGHNAATYSYGIRKKAYDASGAGTPFGTSDLGKAITETDSGDTGIIVDYDTSIGEDQGYVYIRPDALTDIFADVDSAYSVTDSSAAGSFTAASTTGQNLWTNIYTIGTLQTNTQLYLYQNDVEITSWWSTGHIDVIIRTKDAGSLIDFGYLTVFARQYTKLYDHYLVDLSSGTRTPIPLATFNDANNSTGYFQMVLTDATDEFVAGEVIEDDDDATTQGIVTSSSGTAPNVTIQYYLFNTTQSNNFYSGSGAFTGATSGAQATAVNPTSIGPAAIPYAVTITFGATSKDLSNGNGARPYDVIINVNNNTLSNLYQYLKYLTRYGSTTAMNGHVGKDYTAVGDIRLPYTSQSGDFTEDDLLTGTDSGATGIIVADHDAGNSGALVLRDVAGTFQDTEEITDETTGVADVDLSSALDVIAPNKQAPYGSFAGGKFFGARGVWLDNVLGTEANNFELIDSTNTRQVPPATIAITVKEVEVGDRVSIFRTTGANEIINREIYTSAAAPTNVKTNGTFVVQQNIEADTPNTGVLRVVDNSLNREQRYPYSSWSGSTFTLDGVTLDRDYEASDTAYVPFIDEQATSDTVSVSVTYADDRNIITVVRIAGYEPFKIKGVVNTSGYTVSAIRNPDSVYQ